MANIHTPEGFKAHFLSNLTGGTNGTNTAYPRVNFPEFLTSGAKRFKVKAVRAHNGEPYIIYSNDRTGNNRLYVQQLIHETNHNDHTVQNQFLNTTVADYNENKIVVLTPSLANNRDFLEKISPMGGLVHDIMNGNNPHHDLVNLLLTNATLMQSAVDPFIASRILFGFQYPQDAGSHYFTGEGDIHPGEVVNNDLRSTATNLARNLKPRLTTFIKNIFVPALIEAYPEVKVLLNEEYKLNNFVNNIAILVHVANQYEGGYYFNPTVLRKSNQPPKSFIPENLIHKEPTPITLKNIEYYTAQMEKLIQDGGAEALALIDADYVEIVGEQLGGGEDKYNKAPLYKKYIDMKLRLLKMKNKTLSQKSQDKINNVIFEISEREAYLRTVDESLTAYLRDANNKEEEINDLLGYNKLHDTRRKLKKSLNKAYVSTADIIRELARIYPMPL